MLDFVCKLSAEVPDELTAFCPLPLEQAVIIQAIKKVKYVSSNFIVVGLLS
jgi:predicted metal-binding transcription factor (methanogenesis marker protein 9)